MPMPEYPPAFRVEVAVLTCSCPAGVQKAGTEPVTTTLARDILTEFTTSHQLLRPRWP